MERYVKYLRKSRFDRDYAELSVEETLKRHEAILDNLAQKAGYHIAKTYYEVVSGESIADRPQIQKMLNEVNNGLYAGVLVVDLERLARGNGADQAYISQIFQFSGTKIITPNKIYDPANEFDEEYFEFGLFMSRREYKTINRRLIRGRQMSASEGKYIGSVAPYGYNRIKLPTDKGYSLEPNPSEADVVKKIFQMYTSYAGTKIIANYLNDNKIPTRHGDLWTYSTVLNIVTNPVYIGKIKRGYCKQIKSMENGVVKKRVKHLKNPEEYQIFEGLHEPIITEEMFLQAQRIRNEKSYSAKVKDDFELKNAFAGLIFCSVCGKRIGRTTSGSGVARFRCVNHRNCHNGSCNYDVVEKQVIEALKIWLEGYKIKIQNKDYEEEISTCKKAMEQLSREYEQLKLQLENTFDLVEQGVYTLEIFKERREKLTNALNNNAHEQERLEVLLDKMENQTCNQSNILPQAESLLDSYEQMTVSERNVLLKTILSHIDYKKEKNGEVKIDIYPKLPQF